MSGTAQLMEMAARGPTGERFNFAGEPGPAQVYFTSPPMFDWSATVVAVSSIGNWVDFYPTDRHGRARAGDIRTVKGTTEHTNALATLGYKLVR